MTGRGRWTLLEGLAAALVLAALLWLGLVIRKGIWQRTTAIRYGPDMENGWNWGSRAAREGYVGLYDRVVSESPDKKYELDYMPLRLGVMTLWAKGRLAQTPALTGWNGDYAFNASLLRFNSVCEALTAAGLSVLAFDWLRRERRLGDIPPRPLHGLWLSLAVFTFAWLNPASLVSAHARPTWDVWVLPFYVWAIFSAARGWWLTAGCIIGVRTMFKGQELIVAPIFLLWPLMGFCIGAICRFVIGFAAAIAVIASPWLVGSSFGAIAFVIGCSLIPVAMWAINRWWPIRGWSMLARWLRWIIPCTLAASIAACVPLFGGSINWLRVGLIYGADKFDDLAIGGTDSFTAILQDVYRWSPKDPVASLQWLSVHATISNVLITIYGLCLLPIAWSMRRYERAGDLRFVLAMAAPWLIYFVLFPKVHERYLLWGAVAACAGMVVNCGMLWLAIFFSICSTMMSLNQMTWDHDMRHFLTEIGPNAGMRLRQWIAPTSPGIAWAVLLATVIWLWITIAGAFDRKTGRPDG